MFLEGKRLFNSNLKKGAKGKNLLSKTHFLDGVILFQFVQVFHHLSTSRCAGFLVGNVSSPQMQYSTYFYFLSHSKMPCLYHASPNRKSGVVVLMVQTTQRCFEVQLHVLRALTKTLFITCYSTTTAAAATTTTTNVSLQE